MGSPQVTEVSSRVGAPTIDLGVRTTPERCPLRVAATRVRIGSDNMTRGSQGTARRSRQVEVVMGSARTT